MIWRRVVHAAYMPRLANVGVVRSIHEPRGTDRRAPELRDVQGAVLGGQLRGLPRILSVDHPQVTRNAYQRLYDMVLSHGVEEYIDNKKKLVRYKFFRDEAHGGKDAVFGLDVPLMRLMNVLKSAAQGYGTERRIILLHGPVGSAKSTIARQLKKGMEEYSRTRRRRALHVLLDAARAAARARRRQRGVPLADARRAAAPDPARVARRGDRQAQARHPTTSRSRSTAT